MSSLWPRLEPLLAKVQKPARYIGGEDGALTPDHDSGKVGWLLVYPDAYEIGLPNQGLQILYEILNERDDAVAERSYAPWLDLESLMRSHKLPLFSVDTHRPAGEFDLIAFNLSAELVYTNVLNCLDLAGVPVRAADRGPEHPLIGAGGHCTYNPEPLADFVDWFAIGDGEEVVSEITEVVREWKASGRTAGSRERVLHELATIPGVYVPSMYDVEYDGERLASVTPRYADVPEAVVKRTVADLAEWPYPRNQLVPLTEVVHDRLNVEVFRGCTRGCRFCQAGMITRPVRERPEAQVRTMVGEGLRRTGYDEVSLTSLSTADFSGIERVVADVVNDPVNRGQVSVSLPSLRVDAFTVGIAATVQIGAAHRSHVRSRGGLVAAAHGDQQADHRGRPVRRGRVCVLAGLDADEAVLPHRPPDRERRRHARDRRAVEGVRRDRQAVHTSGRRSPSRSAASCPSRYTPFQWFGQNTVDELHRKVGMLRDATALGRGASSSSGTTRGRRWPRASPAEAIAASAR